MSNPVRQDFRRQTVRSTKYLLAKRPSFKAPKILEYRSYAARYLTNYTFLRGRLFFNCTKFNYCNFALVLQGYALYIYMF